VAATSLLFLVILGGLAAYTGGAGIVKGILRVAFWGILAMALTSGVGRLFGVAV
jgi:VIT1/CCC1 family predicted Fe2+/Mn2+ transporter